MALLRMKKGRGGKGGAPPALPPLPMAPAPHHRAAHPAGQTPVVHIHIGPSSAAAHPDEETPEEDMGESPAEETAEGDTPTPRPASAPGSPRQDRGRSDGPEEVDAMGMTALRNKRGIRVGDHTGQPGPGAGGPPDPATLKRISEIARTQGPDAAHAAVGKMAGPQAQQAVAQAGQTMAPRYQKMLADGVDPQVVAKRAAAFSGGQLPGQQSGPAQPEARPSGDLPIQAKPAMLPNGQPMAQTVDAGGRGGSMAPSGDMGKPSLLPNGQPMARPGDEATLPGGGGTLSSNPGQMPTPPSLSGRGVPWQDPGFNQPPPNHSGGPMVMGGPRPTGQFPINPAQGGALSPNAWGALGGAPGGGASGLQSMRGPEPSVPPPGGGVRPMIPNESGGNLLPNGQPMGGAGGGPSYGNDAQARPMGGASGLQSINGGGFQTPPMASVPGAGNSDQVRQQAVARALAGRMAGGGGAFNQ